MSDAEAMRETRAIQRRGSPLAVFAFERARSTFDRNPKGPRSQEFADIPSSAAVSTAIGSVIRQECRIDRECVDERIRFPRGRV